MSRNFMKTYNEIFIIKQMSVNGIIDEYKMDELYDLLCYCHLDNNEYLLNIIIFIFLNESLKKNKTQRIHVIGSYLIHHKILINKIKKEIIKIDMQGITHDFINFYNKKEFEISSFDKFNSILKEYEHSMNFLSVHL